MKNEMPTKTLLQSLARTHQKKFERMKAEIDDLKDRMKLKPIMDLPYDTMVLLRHKDGNFTQGFWYDLDEMKKHYTHWLPLPEAGVE